ncbi:universal stress protein [Fervidicoccus fontis]|jgi:nucleotide-binding universal stress UspA family protein|uniref:Universal stress protein n=2 Tax=Fervidicoccus fontis TaxID=683846 RepID=A0A2J6N451_9CREN|nr:universal stress protein [Fervidicoccus fontis]AFH42397.1 putative stress protein [Fervidicoccus fontis Kam940]MBE9391676.1 universal stress protein [Fervidicoccus fontis]PMB76105.1 MAG: universal stress protein UspE [Fervidicoccus fontis]HEW64394.1 universal stress protein [Fervidicoccus fontis]
MSSYVDRAFSLSYALRRILVAFDGSASSERGLKIALELSRMLGSEVHVIYACSNNSCNENIIKKAEILAKERGVEIISKVTKFNPEESSVSNELIKEINSKNYDLVIMGTRGKTISAEISKGSTAAGVFVNTDVSYLFIK